MIGKITGKSMAGRSISFPLAKAEIGERSVIDIEIGKEEMRRQRKSKRKFPLRLNKA